MTSFINPTTNPIDAFKILVAEYSASYPEGDLLLGPIVRIIDDIISENKKLKQNEEGIMDFKVRGAGLGCNSYEKFINLSSELDYSEDLITQTTTEANRVIKKLKAEIEELKTQLIKVPKHSMNYKYMTDMEKENVKLKEDLDIIHKELWSCDGEYDGKVDESVEQIKKLREPL